QDKQYKEFCTNIYQYNATHTFTSLEASIDQTILNRHASYFFRIHSERASKTNLAVYLYFNAATDHCYYNLPTINEIAIILLSDDLVLEGICDIILHLYAGPLEHIHKGSPAYLPLKILTILRAKKLFQEFLVDA
ncbi:5560_t:CDS:2, partial [Gigaspora rosea]